jgi:hypothetical protein
VGFYTASGRVAKRTYLKFVIVLANTSTTISMYIGLLERGTTSTSFCMDFEEDSNAKGSFIHTSYTPEVSIASTVVARGKEEGRGHTWTSILF